MQREDEMDPLAEFVAAPRKAKSLSMTENVVQRHLEGFSRDPKAIKPQFKKLDEALKHLEHAKGDPTDGPNFHAYSNAIDAYREVLYFLEHSGAGDVSHKFPHLALMSKNPFNPAQAVEEGHGKLFQQAVSEAKHLETEYEHAHKSASVRGVNVAALRVAAMHFASIQRTAAGEVNVPKLERLIASIVSEAKQMESSLNLYKKDPGKYLPQLGNLTNAASTIGSIVGVVHRMLPGGHREASLPPKAQEAALDFLKKSNIGELIKGMVAEAKKGGHHFGMRDARDVAQHWIAGTEPKSPASVAGYQYVMSDNGKHLLSTLTHGVAEALKKAGMKPVGFRDVGAAILAFFN